MPDEGADHRAGAENPVDPVLSAPMPKRLQVALLIERSNAYSRGVLRGIYEYQRNHQPWTIYLADQGLGDSPPDWLKNWRGHGIIARSVTKQIAKAVRAAGVPAIDVSGSRIFPDLPCVETDNEAVSRLVFEHLIQRGFRSLAFCGSEQFAWSRRARAVVCPIGGPGRLPIGGLSAPGSCAPSRCRGNRKKSTSRPGCASSTSRAA